MGRIRHNPSAEQMARKNAFHKKVDCKNTCLNGNTKNKHLNDKCWSICNLNPTECKESCNASFKGKLKRNCKKGCKKL